MLETYTVQNWIDLNQLHAEYVETIRLIRKSYYDPDTIHALARAFMVRVGTSNKGPWWDYFCCKQVMLILSQAPIRDSIRMDYTIKGCYSGFCDTIRQKFTSWQQGTPFERIFVAANQALVERMTTMYQAEPF
jgi:hypothetical protein